MARKTVVVLTGAGISAESGISTFRDANGLWENHRIEDVASPTGFAKNPELVLHFYNLRRAQLDEVEPNEGHRALVRLEEKYDVHIVTQNVDNLHERAGSKNVLHLHGELTKARSTLYPELIYDIGTNPIRLGDVCERGAQLRPHIVWFGEEVPAMREACLLAERADYFLIVGTSLMVYPAAGLYEYAPERCPIYLVDKNVPSIPRRYMSRLRVYAEPATVGVPKVVDELLALD
ncbi:MAG: NAD-dependent deacylase [Bacteroidia bacterium]|nr:NAD-dependent deacylase [Bacteroidia bacterium]MDW8333814.1 NAD-dependent deacylase [Bacteroidia bacterium]